MVPLKEKVVAYSMLASILVGSGIGIKGCSERDQVKSTAYPLIRQLGALDSEFERRIGGFGFDDLRGLTSMLVEHQEARTHIITNPNYARQLTLSKDYNLIPGYKSADNQANIGALLMLAPFLLGDYFRPNKQDDSVRKSGA